MLPSDPVNPGSTPADPTPTDPTSAPATSPASASTAPAATPAPALEVPPAPVRPAGSRARMPVLAIATVVVAILAGGALFVSGFLVGQRAAEQPGTPVAAAEAFQPFWDSYNTIIQRFALGGEDQQTLVDGRDQGHGRFARRPVLGLPLARPVPNEPPGPVGPVRGHRRGDRDDRRERRDVRLHDARDGLRPRRRQPDRGIAGREGRAQARRPIVAIDGQTLDGLTVDAARDKIRGKKGTEVVLSIVRGGAAPIDISIVRDVIDPARRSITKVARRRQGRLRRGDRLLATTRPRIPRRAVKADVAAGEKQFVVDLRGNPGGYVTAAQPVASEFIADGPIFWEQDADGIQTETDATGRWRRDRPTIKVDRAGRQRQRLGQRDRGRRAPGPEAGDDRRPDVLRQGHRPAVVQLRTARRAQADDRQVADARTSAGSTTSGSSRTWPVPTPANRRRRRIRSLDKARPAADDRPTASAPATGRP